MKRHKLGRGQSRKLFSRTASKSHVRNFGGAHPMRGGIRL